MTPKPEQLKDIPLEDTKMVYNAYFNLLHKKDKAKKKVDPAAPKTKSSLVPESLIKEGFDPFADLDIPLSVESLPHHANGTFSKVCENINEYSKPIEYNKYITVYSYLCEAIDAIVATLETFKENEVSPVMLGELLKKTVDDERTCFGDSAEKMSFSYQGDAHSNVSSSGFNVTPQESLAEEDSKFSQSVEIQTILPDADPNEEDSSEIWHVFYDDDLD
ncbi:hypothetical protein JTB14_023000 [Gonioctena quinquepunctata]|nr:hypothetical protein JTB14_023000 [Gonioctena quinquepunctata]